MMDAKSPPLNHTVPRDARLEEALAAAAARMPEVAARSAMAIRATIELARLCDEHAWDPKVLMRVLRDELGRREVREMSDELSLMAAAADERLLTLCCEEGWDPRELSALIRETDQDDPTGVRPDRCTLP